jgi:hypothetical protein
MGAKIEKDGQIIDAGCLCYMPVKADTWSDCWKFENGLTGGWPEELNSSNWNE